MSDQWFQVDPARIDQLIHPAPILRGAHYAALQLHLTARHLEEGIERDRFIESANSDHGAADSHHVECLIPCGLVRTHSDCKVCSLARCKLYRFLNWIFVFDTHDNGTAVLARSPVANRPSQ